jgi:membrane protein YdbS with pleckstrin-like domain
MSGGGPGDARTISDVEPLTADAFDGTPQRLHPRTRIRWAVTPAIVFAVVGIVALVVGLQRDRTWLVAVGVAVGLGGVLYSVAWARLEWSRWSWTVFDDALELRHGVVNRSASLVPFHRIQQIDLHRDPVERALGLSTLVLRTAAATSDAKLPGIDAERAEGLRHRLLARAGLDDAV